MARKAANPPTVATAPAQSERPSRLPDVRAARGRASSSPVGINAWTSASEPISSATAWRPNPTVWAPMPANQAGCRARWTSSPGRSDCASGAARACVCINTDEAPKSAAAPKDSNTTVIGRRRRAVRRQAVRVLPAPNRRSEWQPAVLFESFRKPRHPV